MARRGGQGHETALADYTKQLEDQGYRVLNCGNICPDAIAVKDGQICAVEILRKVHYERKNPQLIKKYGRYTWKLASGTTIKRKRELYSMFDEVLIHVFRDPTGPDANYHK